MYGLAWPSMDTSMLLNSALDAGVTASYFLLSCCFVGNFDFRGVCFTKIADCFKLFSSILCSIGGFFHNTNSRTAWFIACSWKSWLLGRRFCSFYLFVCMPTSCHTLNRPQRLSLVWQNTSPSLALQALEIRLHTLSVNASASSVRLCMAHSHEVRRVSGALVAAHFATTTLPVWWWWDTEQRLWLQDAECTPILFLMDRKAAGRLGLTGLYFAI